MGDMRAQRMREDAKMDRRSYPRRQGDRERGSERKDVPVRESEDSG